jgi:hypothetical protein
MSFGYCASLRGSCQLSVVRCWYNIFFVCALRLITNDSLLLTGTANSAVLQAALGAHFFEEVSGESAFCCFCGLIRVDSLESIP